MSRARNIKPGFFLNESLAELDATTRLLFIGLWCEADREGRLAYRPKKIRAAVFPYETFDVEPMLLSLKSAGFLVIYEVDGQKYIQIKNWSKHQTPHHKEVTSSIPEQPMLEPCMIHAHVKHDASTGDASPQKDASTLLIPDSLIPDSGYLIEDSGGAPPDGGDPPQPPDDDKPDLLKLEAEFVAQWNACDGVTPNRGDRLTDGRRTSFRARLKSKTWLEEAQEAMRKFPLPVSRGSPGSWRPDLEWFLRPDSVTKILEGKYDWSKDGIAARPNSAIYGQSTGPEVGKL